MQLAIQTRPNLRLIHMRRILFVDDISYRHDAFDKLMQATGDEINVTHVYTVDQAANSLQIFDFDEIWLDYDAGCDKCNATFFPVAQMIYFMASDACQFMNGAIVPFDGGESIMYSGEPAK